MTQCTSDRFQTVPSLKISQYMIPLIDFDSIMLYIVSNTLQPLSISFLNEKKGIRNGFDGNTCDKDRE